jgi:RHS repeat-associated protein
VDAVANSSGSVIETRGYDAYGKPRNGSWADLSPAKIASTAVTPKGFTQHEHLNQIELIHMNGRAFDYNLGRFTGVDPFIQFPLNSQSLNPYSYILGNPLSGTDPTGYYGKFDSACDRPSMLGACDTSAGGGNATRKVNAGKANQTGNGASPGSTVTTASRNQGDGQSVAARFGAFVLRAGLPAVDDYAHRGEPGDLGDHAYNGLAALVNVSLDGLSLVPGFLTIASDIPRMEYEAKGLKTGAVVNAGAFLIGGGRSAAGKVGGWLMMRRGLQEVLLMKRRPSLKQLW